MEIKRVDEYIKHGCAFSGKIAVIDYQEELRNDPQYGSFGSMVVFDYTEKAQALAKKRYPNCEILLAIPDVVIRIPDEIVTVSKPAKKVGAQVGNQNAAIHGRTSASLNIRINKETAAYIKSIPSLPHLKGAKRPITVAIGELYENGLIARQLGAAWRIESTRISIKARISVDDCVFDRLVEKPQEGSRAGHIGRLIDLGLWWKLEGAAEVTAVLPIVDNRNGGESCLT